VKEKTNKERSNKQSHKCSCLPKYYDKSE